MPERFSPAQPNYLRFVSTPTIDIEPLFCDGFQIVDGNGGVVGDGLPIDAAEQGEKGRGAADEVKNRKGEGKPDLFPPRHRRDAASFGDKNIDGSRDIFQLTCSDGDEDSQQRRCDCAEGLAERQPEDDRK